MVTSELHLLHKISNGVQRIGGQEASQKWHRERVARMKNAKGKWKISYALGGLAKNLRATYSCGSAAGWAKGEALHMVQRTGSRDRMPVSHNTNPGDALIETQVR